MKIKIKNIKKKKLYFLLCSKIFNYNSTDHKNIIALLNKIKKCYTNYNDLEKLCNNSTYNYKLNADFCKFMKKLTKTNKKLCNLVQTHCEIIYHI